MRPGDGETGGAIEHLRESRDYVRGSVRIRHRTL
jgi:hypothetical protein